MKTFEDLKYRGLINDISSPELEEKLNSESLTFYVGTDPTADSLHIGHFSSVIINAKRLMEHGHKPIILIGGATGLIGDPKPSKERQMISKEQVQKNIEGLTKQIKKLIDVEVVNNYDWCKEINFIDYLRDYGKYFNIGYMLDKDIIRRRLDTGITYTEFSYMLIQSLDFLHLHETKGITLQVAGSDQWGNITAGIELIRKKLNKEVYGFTMPLLTDSQGNKFGKTEGNAIWLDEEKTSSYEMYQYLINSEDVKVIDYLKKLTLLPKEEIEKIEYEHNLAMEKRIAQKALAKEVITFIHGESAYNKALKISEALFYDRIETLSKEELEIAFKNVPCYNLTKEENIIDLLVNSSICASRREAREMVESSAITLNKKKITDTEYMINNQNTLINNISIIRKGKKKYYLIRHL